jgi:PleD family two-component response regulator
MKARIAGGCDAFVTVGWPAKRIASWVCGLQVSSVRQPHCAAIYHEGQRALRVLLVEDEALIADAINLSLKRESYQVSWLRNADAAEEAMLAAQFDLVILDLGLPRRDGLSLLRWMREARG